LGDVFFTEVAFFSCRSVFFYRDRASERYRPQQKKNPSRGDVCELVAQKVFETNVQNGLQEIMIALAEDTVKRGSNF
jgi:hypothetical protein